jgi:hypothetical protein
MDWKVSRAERIMEKPEKWGCLLQSCGPEPHRWGSITSKLGLPDVKFEVINPNDGVVQRKKCGYPTPNMGYITSKMGV